MQYSAIDRRSVSIIFAIIPLAQFQINAPNSQLVIRCYNVSLLLQFDKFDDVVSLMAARCSLVGIMSWIAAYHNGLTGTHNHRLSIFYHILGHGIRGSVLMNLDAIITLSICPMANMVLYMCRLKSIGCIAFAEHLHMICLSRNGEDDEVS
jgi:hypothetical protein